MDPQQARTAETFDRYKDNYSAAVDQAVAFTGLRTDFFTRVKADYIIDEAAKLSGGTKTLDILDVGCGVGNYHPLLAPKFRSLTGVDVSSACIEVAKARNPSLRYEVYEGDQLPFEAESFDVAITICVMHHVPPANWPRFVDEMRRVLKTGGIALVFEHNPRNPLTMRAVNNCAFDEDAVLMRSEEAAQLFADAGFRAVRSRHILNIPPFNALMRRVDGLFERLRFGAQYYVACKK